jgi:thioredoxin-related protein
MKLGPAARTLLVMLVALFWIPLSVAADGDAFFDQTLGDFPAEVQAARLAGKQGLLLMYETEACPFCRRMRREVLSRQDVQDYFRKHFAAFAIDILGDVAITNFAGRETTEKRWSREQRIRATPTFIFIGLDGREMARHTGALVTGEEFLQLGRYVAEGHYRRQTFEQFRPETRSGNMQP